MAVHFAMRHYASAAIAIIRMSVCLAIYHTHSLISLAHHCYD